MTAGDLELLKDVIDGNEGQHCRILFADDEEFDVSLGHWWQDFGERPQADATVLATINSKRNWKIGAAITFDFSDVVRISDTKARRIIFETKG
jgi:hypothetical protein